MDELHDDDDELDGFKDFTVSSSWERLIAAVESQCREWLSAGRKQLLARGAQAVEGLQNNLYQVEAEVSKGAKKYKLTLYFSSNDTDEQASEEWQPELHHLQLWFGVKDFMVISPVTFSGVLLDPPEATMLLSTVSIALSNCGSTWPVFVPVHVPIRKAYLGIESATTSSSVKFEADKLGTQVPVKLMHLEGLYDLFVSKLGRLPEDMCRFGFTMRLTYATPSAGFRLLPIPDGSDGSPKAEVADDELDGDVEDIIIWDDEFPWAEWHSVEDPVNGFELTTVWRNAYVSSPMELAEFENASTLEADIWTLKPLRADEPKGGFTGRLRRLVEAFVLSKEGEYVEDFVNVIKPSIEKATVSMKVPPSTVLDRVLKDIFFQVPQASKNESSYARMVKAAPSESLFGRFCSHALWYGDCNIRAIAVLWNEFIREVRWCWEELQHLPRHSPTDAPDFSTCLVHQKLQLLAACIDRNISRKSMDVELRDWLDDASSSRKSCDIRALKKYKKETSSALKDSGIELMETDCERKGSAGPFGNATLSRFNTALHAPLTQSPPIMTEDMLQEREQALASLDTSPRGNAARIRLQSDMLTSDMAAFKAANPGALLEDFVRWHSPRDWIEDDEDDGDARQRAKGKAPAGGRLSKRMSQPGNAWEKLWGSVRAVPASEQKLLFDYMREGEKVIHYLETLRPHQLLAQMLCTSFMCAADLLSKTPGCSLEPVVSQFDELYAIMAVVLEPLGNIAMSDDQVKLHMEEWQRDLMELCTTFGKVEQDVALCASLSQKLPNSSSGLLSALLTSKGNVATLASYRDRDTVADGLFSQQNVSQTWQESLRMGNFMNGHEPLRREIVFTHYGGQVDGYGEKGKVASNSRNYSHRMYICGTADDLQVAIASGSQD